MWPFDTAYSNYMDMKRAPTGFESNPLFQQDYAAGLALQDAAAKWWNTPVSQLTPAQVAQYNTYMNQNTGLNGWANQTFGGWGNAANMLGQVGNIAMGILNYNQGKDALAAQIDMNNKNWEGFKANFYNQQDLINQQIWDRERAREWTEEGNLDDFERRYEEKKLDRKL